MPDRYRPEPALTPTPEEVAQWIGGTLLDAAKAPRQLTGLATVDAARESDIVFAASANYVKSALASSAGLLILPLNTTQADGRARVEVKEVWVAVAEIMRRLYPQPRPDPGIHSTAAIGKDVKIGEGASIGPFCSLGDGVEIGAGAALGPHCSLDAGCRVGEKSRLHSHVVLQGLVHVGRRVTLHSGVILGADGFKFEGYSGGILKIPQVGRVLIEDEVEIGACTTIDRAFLSETRIGFGTKIDNHVQIGHNCDIGRFVIVAGCTGFAGSVTIEDFCVIGGAAGFRDGITLGRGSKVAGGAGVTKNHPAGSILMGKPAIDLREQQRIDAHVRRLPKLVERVTRLESRAVSETD